MTVMASDGQTLPRYGLLTTFVLPALLVFLVPALSLGFFLHIQGRRGDEVRESALGKIRADRKLTEEERARAIAALPDVPLSRLVAVLPRRTRFQFATLRWMILISEASLLAGVAIFLLAGVSVAISIHSSVVQYLSLSVGWHVLRIFGTLHAAAHSILLVGFCVWICAWWRDINSSKLLLAAGFLAVVSVLLVTFVIFQRVTVELAIVGEVLPRDETTLIWNELIQVCSRVGTRPPDRIVAGIDAKLFVTEHPVTVGYRTYQGRTLFISLSLLKQLQGGEARAVLAHEMAHFSGRDTLYSRKIIPLVSRYDRYLRALHDQDISSRPIFYFMLCFRALYQISLDTLGRKREFRADRIAVEATSVRDVAGCLLRTVAYSSFLADVERELFVQERALGTAKVSERIDQWFREYAARFLSGPHIGQLAPAHPFDLHPPLAERLKAIGMPLESMETQSLLAAAGDGKWYHYVPAAERIEQSLWRQHEEEFGRYHKQSLPYRFLPETDAEYKIVVESFPPLEFTGSAGTLALDHEKISYDEWPDPIYFREVTKITVGQESVLEIRYKRDRVHSQLIKTSEFTRQQMLIDAVPRYYGRYQAAVEYQKRKRP